MNGSILSKRSASIQSLEKYRRRRSLPPPKRFAQAGCAAQKPNAMRPAAVRNLSAHVYSKRAVQARPDHTSRLFAYWVLALLSIPFRYLATYRNFNYFMMLYFYMSSFTARWAQKTGDSLIRLVYTSIARGAGFETQL